MTVRWLTRLLVLAIATLYSGCSAGNGDTVATPVQFSGQTMGTTYSIKIAGKPLGDSEVLKLKSHVDDALVTLNRQMSTYDPESELSRFNRYQQMDPFPVSEATQRVVAQSIELYQQSEGSFDVTVGPLVNLWGFGPEGRRTQPPSPEQIAERRKSVGSDKLRVQEKPAALVKSEPSLKVDLSAIAKGYGVDMVSELLAGLGFHCHMVEIGGEVVCRGMNAQGNPWRIGIERPGTDFSNRAIEEVVQLTDRAMATSGNYRNYFNAQGKHFSHTIDPATGCPVEHTLASVTVIAPNCMLADGLATAVMVMGPQRGLQWLESLDEVEGLLLVANTDGTFSELTTTGMSAYIKR